MRYTRIHTPIYIYICKYILVSHKLINFSNGVDSFFHIGKWWCLRIICWMLQFQLEMGFLSVEVRIGNYYCLRKSVGFWYGFFSNGVFFVLDRQIFRWTKSCWWMVQARKDCKLIGLIFCSVSVLRDYDRVTPQIVDKSFEIRTLCILKGSWSFSFFSLKFTLLRWKHTLLVALVRRQKIQFLDLPWPVLRRPQLICSGDWYRIMPKNHKVVRATSTGLIIMMGSPTNAIMQILRMDYLQGLPIETCSFCAIDGFALKVEALAIRQLF